MSDRDLFDAVARKTGEDSHELARRGFVLSSLDRPPVQISGTQADLAGSRSGPLQRTGRRSFENIEEVIVWPRGRPAGVARG
jgi:hypothetical protein